ncbi:hypothetical protein Jiend_53900 [Micromonospora endophytica]|nr:hypothetical protein Jiend_53900 [Micromonospora endophytica]
MPGGAPQAVLPSGRICVVAHNAACRRSYSASAPGRSRYRWHTCYPGPRAGPAPDPVPGSGTGPGDPRPDLEEYPGRVGPTAAHVPEPASAPQTSWRWHTR